MPGRLGRNLRKGHIAEDIGIGVLRGFSAVATVRQQDDIGVDAFAILLSQDGQFLHAESTFGVQFKAKSIKDVFYDVKATQWFKELEIPLFFSRVDSIKGEISFYSTNRWNQLNPSYKYKDICFKFDNEEVCVSDEKAMVGLHPPILSCTELESKTDDFAANACVLFKKWVEFESESLRLRKYNIFQSAKWKTGQEPTIYYKGSITNIEKRMEDLIKAKPIIEKLVFHAVGVVEPAPDLLKAFLRIYKWYKDEGVTEEENDQSDILRFQIEEWER